MPDEDSFVNHQMSEGFSFSYPAGWEVEELHEAVWMRNYCRPSIWLNAGWYEMEASRHLSTEERFLNYVREGLARGDGENRFHPSAHSSEIVNLESRVCIRSVGKLEEHSTQEAGKILNYIDRGDLKCLHPTSPGLVIHLFYWVEDNRSPSTSPEQIVGELFLDSLKLEDRDNNGFNTDADKPGAG